MTDYRGTDDVLARADALMRRPRVFVAQSKEAEGENAKDEADGDLPVLTEVVDEDGALLAGAVPETVGESSQGTEDLARTIESELATWLDRELPKAVLRVTDTLADRLIEELGTEARTHLLAALIRRLDTKSDGAPDG